LKPVDHSGLASATKAKETVNSVLLLSCRSILSKDEGGANIWELFW